MYSVQILLDVHMLLHHLGLFFFVFNTPFLSLYVSYISIEWSYVLTILHTCTYIRKLSYVKL